MKLAISCAIALLASAAAQATCIPPPPDAFSNATANNPIPQRVGDDARLPVRRPLTGAGTDYSCPMPIEIGVAYRVYNYRPVAIVHALLDEQIQQAGLPTTSAPSAPAWDSTRVYLQGERASFNGAVYLAQWWTQGEPPGSVAYGAWKVEDGGGIGAWSASRAYQAEEKVVYANTVWKARWWSQGEQPGSNEWGAWLATTETVPQPVALPSRYSASLSWNGGELTVNVQSVNGAISGRPAYLEVREQGVALGRITQFPALYHDCFGLPECQPGSYWTGYGKFTTTQLPGTAWVSLWACNSQNVCRPAEATRIVLGQTITGHLSEPMPLEGDPRTVPQ
ncbi:carbohydrate-binding protein [Chitiniphilus eburneus]|uniref:Chitin-binding type-3 domain-containing protein n=1 Tax=Chitiniphilus eburneus TaxID=2571148 RepID=A0A4U0PNE6_9NEIS|nr:carbohydrate-binding protein [Chitiniphilus eburneus]TJZ69763.1 hypothetical protein FAZ21_14690 [Chitiniphilus eburneus]